MGELSRARDRVRDAFDAREHVDTLDDALDRYAAVVRQYFAADVDAELARISARVDTDSAAFASLAWARDSVGRLADES